MNALFKRAAGLVTALIVATSTAGAQVFVGSWQVFHPNAPTWHSQPLAYTGQEAAALLFGGLPSDYVISTVDDQASNINFSAWYDIIGFGGAIKPQDYFVKYEGQYYGPTNGYSQDGTGAASAFVQDNQVYQTNYAFRTTTTVPEPSTYALMAAGLAGVFFARRRRTV